MSFDPTSTVIQLCAKGIEMEAENPEQAKGLFLQAWSLAATDVEKFTAAHYMARHQDSVAQKLEWDLKALQLALQIQDGSMTASYPSLYLNVGKGYEDLGDVAQAKHHYQLALSYSPHLADEGYTKDDQARDRKRLKSVSCIALFLAKHIIETNQILQLIPLHSLSYTTCVEKV